MELNADLQKKIIDFLISLPGIKDSYEQQALILRTGLDKKLQHLIRYEGSAAQFFNVHVPKLIDYGTLEDGRNTVEAILETAKDFVGKEKQEICEDLIQQIREIHQNLPPVSPSKERQEIEQ